MILKLFLLFTLIPLAELYILMKLGAAFGVGSTLILVIGTGLLGAYLAKKEGLRILVRLQEEMNNGRLPASELIDAFLVFVSGVVLITPGLLTDILGFLILIPWTRTVFKRLIVEKLRKMMQDGRTNITFFRGF